MKKQILLAVSVLALSATTSNAKFYGKTSLIYGGTAINSASGIIATGYGIEAGYQLPEKWLSIGVEKQMISHASGSSYDSGFGNQFTINSLELDSLLLNVNLYWPSQEIYRPFIGGSYGKTTSELELKEDSSGDIFNYSEDLTTTKYRLGIEVRIIEKGYFTFDISRRMTSGGQKTNSTQTETGSRGTDFTASFKYLF